jgi:hypothetical protein
VTCPSASGGRLASRDIFVADPALLAQTGTD